MTLLRIWSSLIGISLCALVSTVFADIPRGGLALSAPLVAKDPKNLRGYQIAAWYQPKALIWNQVRIYFNVSAAHWWVGNSNHFYNVFAGHWWTTTSNRNHSLNIYAVSPILRYYFLRQHSFSPFLNFGIGLSYLSRTRLGRNNLGMHFAFQDQFGLGATFGKRQELSVILSALHYSNGSLCAKNAGITVPIEITVEYGFA